MIKEECGVAGVVLKKPIEDYPVGGALYYLHLMMSELQHRGQETAGFITFNPGKKKTLDGLKSLGRVSNLFCTDNIDENIRILEEFTGTSATGHVRYSTSGNPKTEREYQDEAQPFYHRDGNPNIRFVYGWNGNLANHEKIEQVLKEEYSIEPETNVDTELLMYLIANNIRQQYNKNRKINYYETFKEIQGKIDGGLSLILMNGLGHLIGYRGIPGIMPLCYGENDDLFAVASETCALSIIGIRNYKFFKSGELIVHKNNSAENNLISENPKFNACFFQWVYFAKVTSILDNLGVNELREKLGKKLAELEPLKDKLNNDYVIVPVPDTSIPAAKSMAKELEIPYEEVLIKNPQAGRTFIVKENVRNSLMERKFGFIPGKVEGKKIILVEDSIVRGNTGRKIISFVREALKPEEIHFRSTCPPIRSPCYYGVDFPTLTELIAHDYIDNNILEKDLAEIFSATTVKYMTLEGLIEVFAGLNFPSKNLCLACLTGDYPTDAGNKRLAELLS